MPSSQKKTPGEGYASLRAWVRKSFIPAQLNRNKMGSVSAEQVAEKISDNIGEAF